MNDPCAEADPLQPITVVAGLIQHAGRLLICQRRQGDAFALKWEFPGGKVQPGETPEASLHRELQEELGIDAAIGPLLYRTRHHYAGLYTVELLFYQVIEVRGRPQNRVFEQVRWVPPAHLPSFDFLEGDAEFIALLRQGQLPPTACQP